MTADNLIVEFLNAGLAYGDEPETLSDIDLQLREGEFRFLTGPSGAGKTSSSHSPKRSQKLTGDLPRG